LDGMNQSTSSSGPQVYQNAIDNMSKQYDDIMRRIKSLYTLTNFASDVG